MKIGIVVYSKTGHTLSVAKKLQQSLIANGNDVTLFEISSLDDIKLNQSSMPDLSSFDLIYFGSWVQGFALSQVMKQYLERIESLSGKTVNLFLTQYFRFSFLGGNSSIKTMTSLCQNKGANVQKTGIVHWGKKIRDKQINELLQNLTAL